MSNAKASVLWEGDVPLDDGDTIRGRVVLAANRDYVAEVFTTDAMDEVPAWRQVAVEGDMGTIMGTAIRDLAGRRDEAPPPEKP